MKPKDPIWSFYIITEDGKNVKAKCKDCNADVSSKVIRLRSHREKCPGLSKPGKQTEKRRLEEVNDDESQPKVATTLPPKKPRLQQPSVSSYCISTDVNTWEQLDQQIAKLFYACNLPFSLADHPVWKETVDLLRPGYHPPNRKNVGGPLLDKIHEKLTNKMKTELRGKNVVLMQDGWSDIHNTPVIATSLHTEGTAYFLSAVDTGTNKKTAAYCTTVAQDAINEAKDKYECTVTGVVTDNEKKMELMKQNLKEADPELTVYGCSAHWLNLLGQGITPSQVISQVVEVNKYFRNHHVPGALLSEMAGTVKPQLPQETRWNSQMRCVETFIRNSPYMMLIAAQNEELLDSRIRKLIHNVGLYNEAKSLFSQLDPISKALDKLQSDSAEL